MKVLLVLIILVLSSVLLLSIVYQTVQSKGKTKTTSKIKILDILEINFETEHNEHDDT